MQTPQVLLLPGWQSSDAGHWQTLWEAEHGYRRVEQHDCFPAVLVGSRNDPYCRFERAQALASDWGARFIDAGERGHINAESGLGAWSDGMELLQSLLKD
jgi:predicted alpha/beta hydrolase family esterase